MVSDGKPAKKQYWLILTIVLAGTLWVAVFLHQQSLGRVQRHIDSGMECIRLGKPQEAEHEWLEAVRQDPQSAVGWDLLSELYINTQQWTRGTRALTNLQKIDPDKPFVYSKLAACALRSGNEIEAMRCAQEALKRNPDDDASLNILAFLSSMQENAEKQIGYLLRVLKHNPDDMDTLHSLAQAYKDAGKHAEIIPVVDHMLALKPGDSFAIAMRGAARFEIDASPGATALAEADLLKACQMSPLSAFARYSLGKVYLREAKYSKAITEMELAQQIYPNKMDVPFELAIAYSRAGMPAKAEASRQRFEKLRQEATEVNILQKRCALNGNDFAAFLRIGQIQLANGDLRQAMYYLQHALSLQPSNPEVIEANKKLSEQMKNETS